MSQSAGAASSAGSGASAAGSAGSGALSAAPAATSAASTYGTMANAALDTGANTGAGMAAMGPTVQNAMSTYGTVAQAPNWLDKTMDFMSRYQKGADSNMLDAYKGAGMNAETVGYLGGKVKSMFSGGGGNQPAAPININASYQQPENEYLLRRYLAMTRR